MKNVKDRLKMEEKEAWFETTKNINQMNKKAEPELVTLKHLMRAGLPEDNLVDVKVLDRIKHEYLDHVQQKMSENCKDVETMKMTAE